MDITTPEGKQSGLLFDSAITCENLATVHVVLIKRTIGTLPAATMPHQVNDCLRAALEL